MQSTSYAIMTIAVVVLGTMLTRFLPFIIFPSNKQPAPIIKYLGNTLPGAVIALLVVYSLKDTAVLTGNHGLPELISISVIVILHLWRRNMLLSIAAGTIIHMVLLQTIFVG